MKTVNIYDEIYEQLVKEKKETGKTINYMVNVAVAKYIDSCRLDERDKQKGIQELRRRD